MNYGWIWRVLCIAVLIPTKCACARALRCEHNFHIYIPPLHIITHYYCHHRNGCSIIFKRALSCAQRQTMAIDDAMAEWIEKYLRINKWYEKVLLSIRTVFFFFFRHICALFIFRRCRRLSLSPPLFLFSLFPSPLLCLYSFSANPASFFPASLSSLRSSPPCPPQNSIFVWLLFIVIQNERKGTESASTWRQILADFDHLYVDYGKYCDLKGGKQHKYTEIRANQWHSKTKQRQQKMSPEDVETKTEEKKNWLWDRKKVCTLCV